MFSFSGFKSSQKAKIAFCGASSVGIVSFDHWLSVQLNSPYYSSNSQYYYQAGTGSPNRSHVLLNSMSRLHLSNSDQIGICPRNQQAYVYFTASNIEQESYDIIKSTDKYTKGLTDEGKIKVKGNVSSALSKLSKITKKKPVEKKAKGGRVGLKSGNGFPDLSGDGKTTFKDILIGRGVIKKGKKKTMMAKKSKTPMDKAVRKDKKKKRII